jgi:transposase InsO family protein
VHKVYLSAILDLYDRRIVSFATSEHNDTPLVFKTFDRTVKDNLDAHPLFHSDRGFQYMNRTFHHKLEKAGMTQSMSRVAHCIDNGPMEGFWRERYYNTRRVQRNLGVLTPLEKHNLCLAA